MSIDLAELRRGVAEFERREGRDSMYRVATFLLESWWGDWPKMTDALSVLLLTWNQAFYRYGLFEREKLEEVLQQHWSAIVSYRAREIETITRDDYPEMTSLFEDMLNALANKRGKSPVAVAKALHLLAPGFFPLWDKAIAENYGCSYSRNPVSAYLAFCEKTKASVLGIGASGGRDTKSLLKMIDEYNYARFTKHWI